MTEWSLSIFEKCLYKYLSTMPDEPQIAGYTVQRRVDSNSILDTAKSVNDHLKWKCLVT